MNKFSKSTHKELIEYMEKHRANLSIILPYDELLRRVGTFCDSCMEKNCSVSSDGTCSMIRKYLKTIEK